MSKKKQNTLRTITIDTLQKVLPARLIQSYAHRKTIEEFADRLGLVYFGFVDQHIDEHELVRGFTLSAEHRDNHYCVGNAYGYDVTLVERADTLRSPKQREQTYRWVILQIDLRSADLPHMFMTPVDHSETFYTNFFIKYARFQRLSKNIWQHHDPLFRDRLSVFAAPEAAEQLAKLFSMDVTAAIGHYFGTLEVEIYDDKLYIYDSEPHQSQESLERLFKNGLWLAGQIDAGNMTNN